MVIKRVKRRMDREVAGVLSNISTSIRRQKKIAASGLKELDEIKKLSLKRTEISDHLVTLFVETLKSNPRLIVELGVGRPGVDACSSTFVLESVAKMCGAKLIGIDVEDSSKVSSWKDWIFVQSDDVEYAKHFKALCEKHGIKPEIDVLFIDTSHLYEHTVKEIEEWFPFLTDNAKVFFHDTNLKLLYKRKDKSLGRAWDNERGVIRALEKYFDTSFNEKEEFVDIRKGWLIKHCPYCNGLTVLEKLKCSR